MGPRLPEVVALGLAVREARTRISLSQEEVGQRADVHRNHVGAVERGELNPSFSVLVRLAAAVAVRPAELVERAMTMLEGATDR